MEGFFFKAYQFTVETKSRKNQWSKGRNNKKV